jgi:hypothetical protein
MPDTSIFDFMANNYLPNSFSMDEENGLVVGQSITYPDLDYYDNRRDRNENDELIPNEGSFGKWRYDLEAE